MENNKTTFGGLQITINNLDKIKEQCEKVLSQINYNNHIDLLNSLSDLKHEIGLNDISTRQLTEEELKANQD